MLSHGHYDHFGGLAGFLGNNAGRLKPKLPFYVGGEDAFCAREWVAPPVKGNFGVIDREALKAADLMVMSTPEPSLVGGHGFTSGRIAEQSFEKLKSPSVMTLGMDHGSGCSAAGFSDAEQKLGSLLDQFNHEIATAFNLKVRGLIVLTSCSHRGVVNAVRQAQEVSGVKKVHAIIGGFHLAPYPPEYLAETLSALKEIGPIISFRCIVRANRFSNWRKANSDRKSSEPTPARGSTSVSRGANTGGNCFYVARRFPSIRRGRRERDRAERSRRQRACASRSGNLLCRKGVASSRLYRIRSPKQDRSRWPRR